MEKYNITYDDIISHIDENKRWIIDGKNWFQYYTFTKAEADEFRKKAVCQVISPNSSKKINDK